MVKEIGNPPAVQGEEALLDQPRTLEQLTTEILYIKAQTCVNYWEMGCRLKEVKAQLPHGEWGKWLAEAVGFSQESARRLISIADAFPNSNPGWNLNYSQVWMLTTASPEIREDILAHPQLVDGQMKTVDEMSKRELEKVIRERKAAEKEAQKAKAELKEERALRAQAQNKSAALSAQLEESQRQTEEAREEGRREEREAQRIPIPAVNAEKALEREIGRISSSLGDSLPVLLECIRFTGSQEMVNDILGLSDDLEETAKELKGAAIAARNNSFLTRRDEEEDFSWLEE